MVLNLSYLAQGKRLEITLDVHSISLRVVLVDISVYLIWGDQLGKKNQHLEEIGIHAYRL